MSRRGVLLAGTALGASTLAGCSSVQKAVSGGGGGGYTTWLAAPSVIGGGDSYDFVYVDGATFTDAEDRLEEYFYGDVVDTIAGEFSDPDVDPDDVEGFVQMDLAGAAETDLDAEDLTEPLEEDDDYEEDGEYNGFTVYVEAEGEQAFGIQGGDIAYGELPVLGGGNARNRLEGVIDAKTGSGERYTDVSDPVDLLTDALGDQTFIEGDEQSESYSENPETGLFEGQVAQARALDLSGDETVVTYARVVGADKSVSQSDADAWAEQGKKLDRLEDVSVSVDGRVVTATGTTDKAGTDDFWD